MNSFIKKSSSVLLVIVCTQSVFAMDGELLRSSLAARSAVAQAVPEDEEKEAAPERDIHAAVECGAGVGAEHDTSATIVLSNGTREQIDLARIECPIACDNFQNLFTSLAPADHLILSRVVTRNRAGDQTFIHYYDGVASREAFMRKDKNPMNGLVPQSIEYFRYDAVGKKFNALCSHEQLNMVAKDSYLAQFFHVQFNDDLAHKALLQWSLGHMHCVGEKVEKDYKQASTYLQATLASGLLGSGYQALAHYILGNIYYYGGAGVEKDYKQVNIHLKAALDSELLSQHNQVVSQFKLGAIYYDGDASIEKNYKQASVYLRKALASGLLDLDNQILVQLKLDAISALQLEAPGHGEAEEKEAAELSAAE